MGCPLLGGAIGPDVDSRVVLTKVSVFAPVVSFRYRAKVAKVVDPNVWICDPA